MKMVLQLVAAATTATFIFYSTDFHPSWVFLAILGAVAIPVFNRARAFIARKQETATKGILKTGNVTSLALLATLAVVYFAAMPTGKFLTFSLGTTGTVAVIPIAQFHGVKGYCSTGTLVELAGGRQIWACGSTGYTGSNFPNAGRWASIRLSRSFFGYYARVRH